MSRNPRSAASRIMNRLVRDGLASEVEVLWTEDHKYFFARSKDPDSGNHTLSRCHSPSNNGALAAVRHLSRILRGRAYRAKVRAARRERDARRSLTPPAPDVKVRNEGTVWAFVLISEAAYVWVCRHVGTETMMGSTLVVEHRYAPAIVEGMREAGLNVIGVAS